MPGTWGFPGSDPLQPGGLRLAAGIPQGRDGPGEVTKMRITAADLMTDIDRHTNSVGRPWYPVSAVSEFAKIIDWFDGVDTVEFSCHPDCGFAKNPW